MTLWLLFVGGVIAGWIFADIRSARADAKLWRRLAPRISNTAAPTTSELHPDSVTMRNRRSLPHRDHPV